MNILIEHIIDVLPFFIIFEICHIGSKNIFREFNTTYFLLHFIVNCINTYLLIPLIYNIIYDPIGKYILMDNWNKLDIIYPMIIGLHTFHLVHNISKIYYDEIIHHILTHIFWYFISYTDNPFYIAPIIAMSGIPGGITYLLLFINKYNLISRITEKKISMYLNIWLRAPMCIIFATLLYIQGCNNNIFYETLFMVLFIIVNGIHFMHNITESYYINILNN
jgi:hypothetical protein